MKAVILVGGKATRLLPLTFNIPKAMVPVLNVPFLEHVIRHLSHHQVKEIVLAQGHLSQPIRDYFGDGSYLGVKIHYSYEDTPMGTAGAIKNAERYLLGTFVALNGDSFTDLDITTMLKFHQKKNAKLTIALTSVADPTSYGLIETNAEGRVICFIEKPERNTVTTSMINAGTYVLESEVLTQIPPQTQVSIERETFPKLLAHDEAVYAYSSSTYWLDIGTPDKYLQLNRDLLTSKCQQHVVASVEGTVIGQHSNIHHTVEIIPPVLIGDRCSIGRGVKLIGPVTIGNGCTISENCMVKDCVIWRNVWVGREAEVENSIVGSNCRLNANSRVEGSVLGDNVTISRGHKLQSGSRIWPSTTMG